MKNTIGERIRKCRASSGLSQDYVADKLNISTSAYSNIETNKTELTVSRLIKLADILNVDLYVLLGINQQPKIYSTPEGMANNIFEEEMNAMKLQIKEMQTAILEMQKSDKKKKQLRK